MHRSRRTAAGALSLSAVAVTLLVAGCTPQGSQDSPAPPPQQTPVCAAVDNLDSSLEEFRHTVTPDATAEELRTARDNVRVALDTVATEVQDLAQVPLTDLDAQVGRFQAAVDDVADSPTVQDAADALRTRADAIDAALNDLENDLKC